MTEQRQGGPSATDGPLTGLRVLDCATMLAGPLCCQLLGDMGAEVIKVEHPGNGDSMRGHGKSKDGVPLWWKVVGRNKRTIGLDLGDPDGADLFVTLAATADVVVEGFRPGTLERWGLAPERLLEANGDLVIVRVSGFGQEGPYAGRPAFGTLIEAMSGFATITGAPDDPPVLPPFGLADGVAGIAAAFATMTALYEREARGGGQVVDMAILEPLVTVLGPQPTVYDQLGELPQRHGNRSGFNAPRNTYLTADGRWVAVSTSASSIARRVMELVGHPEVTDEPWFATGGGRAEHAELLDEMVGSWIGARTRDEVTEAFEKANAAVAPVYDVSELMADPQVIEREVITTVDDPELGPVQMQNLLFRLSRTPGRIRFTGRPQGADTDEVLGRDLGVSAERLTELRERGIVA